MVPVTIHLQLSIDGTDRIHRFERIVRLPGFLHPDQDGPVAGFYWRPMRPRPDLLLRPIAVHHADEASVLADLDAGGWTAKAASPKRLDAV